MKPTEQGREARHKAYRELLLDPRWRLRRQEVFEAKGRRCEDCGSTEGLEVHHGYYRSGRMPWEYPDTALHVLCSKCHGDEHRDGPVTPALPLIRSLSATLTMPKKDRDPRKSLWEIAQSHASSRADATALMAVLSWLWFKRGMHDLGIANRVAQAIGGMTNPYAYLQPGGAALESLIGARAVERAEGESQQHRLEDSRAGIRVRSKP